MNKFVVIVGSLTSGIVGLYGTFDSHTEAVEWSESFQKHETWHVMQLESSS